MGTNSIKSNLTKETIISEIKLLSGTKNNEDKVYIIVEGEDDIKFFKKFLKANVIIYESFSGKKGVEALQKAYEVTEANTISKLPVGQKLLAMLHKAIEYKTGIFFFF